MKHPQALLSCVACNAYGTLYHTYVTAATTAMAKGVRAQLLRAHKVTGPMIVVGLTGGIATGKSTVTALLRQYGVTVLDCDEIAHAVVRQVFEQRHTSAMLDMDSITYKTCL